MVENVACCALLHNAAVLDEHDMVGSLPGEPHLVGDHEHGHAVRGKLPDDFEHAADHLRVEGGGGLVKQQKLRFRGDGPCDAHALLLPAGQGAGVAVGEVGEPHAVKLFTPDGFGRLA